MKTDPRILGKVTSFIAPDIPNKNYLMSGSSDLTVRVWNIEYAAFFVLF